MEQKNALRLRAHHGLCVRHFRGRGYSDAFVAHMTAVAARLAGDPAQPVKLLCAEDTLCAHCPHNQGGCDAGVKPERLDRRCLAACGLTAGEEIAWGDYQTALEQKVLHAGRFREICGDCEWFSLCAAILAREGEAACCE